MEPISTASTPDSSWSTLPDDILQQVLARLPLQNLLLARTVCKHWAALSSTPTFLTTLSHIYFPVTIQGIAYDHTAGAWQKLPPLGFAHEPSLPVAAAAGLLCLQTPAFRYVLCNPVTRTRLALPEVAPKWSPLTSPHILPDASSFRILVVGRKVNSDPCVALYSSATGAWAFRDAHRAVGCAISVVCGGVLYCGVGDECVMGYDIDAEVWQEGVHTIPPQPDYQLTQMVECGGEVYMALARGYGGVGAGGVVSSLRILHLEGDAVKVWREVGSLGDEMLRDLQDAWLGDDDSGAIVCVGCGSRICVAAGLGCVLVFDVAGGCWSQLPPPCGEVVGADPFHFPVELRLMALL